MPTNILASVSVVLGAEISEFRAKMAEARRELSGLIKFSEGARDIGESLTKYVSAPLALLGGAALAASAQIDTLRRGLQAVTQQQLSEDGVTGIRGIAQASTDTKARLIELRQVAALPGLGFAEAVQGDIRLRAVGISADLSKRALLAFGNAIATTGGGKGELDRVTVQLGQLSAKGKVLAQDLRPIIEAAPAVATALKKLYGTVDSETISKSLEKQGKSSIEFIDVLTNELAKLPSVTGGLKNAFENLADSGQIGMAKLGDSLNKAFNVEENLGKLGNFVTALADKFEALSPAGQKAIFVVAGLAAAAGPLLFAVGAIGAALPAITAGFAALGLTSLGALSPLLLPIAAVAAGAVLIYQNWDKLGPVFTEAAATIGTAIGQISKAFDSIDTGNSFGDLLKGLNLVDVLVREIKAGVQGLADTFGGTVAFITSLLKGDFTGALEGIRQTAEGLLAPLLNVFGIVRTKAVELKGSFAAAFQPIEEVTGLLGGDLAGALPKVTKLTKEQADALAKLRKEAEDAAKAQQKLNEGYDQIANRRVKGLEPKDAPDFTLAVPGLAGLPEKLPALDITPFVAPLQEASAQLALFQLTAELFSADLSKVIEQAFVSTAAGIGEAIGQIALGAGGFELVGAALLAGIGSLAIQLGQLAIGAGIAVAGIKAALETLNPVAAIAGGIALVALGTFVKGKAASLASSGGGGASSFGGGGNSTRPSFTPSTAPAATAQGGPTIVTHNVVFDLQGNNLLAAININTDRLGRVTGRY